MDYYNLDKKKVFLISQKAIITNKNKILVLRLGDFGDKKWSYKWQLPGGLLEMEEDFKVGLKREVKEETGLSIRIGKVFSVAEIRNNGFVFKDKRKLAVRIVNIGFICTTLSRNVKLSDEHINFKWVNKREFGKLKFSPDSEDIAKEYLKD